MDRIPIAVQLYSVRGACEQDLPGALEAIYDMGYEGVEFAGYYGRSAAELREMLDGLKLRVAGSHTPLDHLLGDNLEATVEFNKTLGNQCIIVPSLPGERRGSRDAWIETARLFNELAAKLKPHGLRVGYHNHSSEFKPIDGEPPLDIFLGNTGPDVLMQLDVGNALRGGADVASFIRRYPGRQRTVHLKEYSSKNKNALLGEGEAPWKELFRLCETVGDTEWYIVEQETYPYEPLECIARCLENLDAMGK
ncbi:MAG: sugar phosphate isomerase/epimerase [Planctomycetes bacterium]|nr:sugar phosphate isomerase/epimerase [Planctomycetota bacterium]